MVRKLNTNTYENGVVSALWDNSAVFTMHCFVNKNNNVLELATAWSNISWIAMEAATMASDNETVAQAFVNYEEPKDSTIYEVEISWGTITAGDESKYYDLTDSDTVDGTSESDTTGQLQLVKYISSTKGGFKVANA